MPSQIVTVVGALTGDLTMVAPRLPDPGETLRVSRYHEGLGGKGANSAIATHRTSHNRPVNPEPAIDASSAANPGAKQDMPQSTSADAPQGASTGAAQGTSTDASQAIPAGDPVIEKLQSDIRSLVVEQPRSDIQAPVTKPVRTDIQVRMIGAVGDDQFAAMFHKTLKENQIDISGLKTVPGVRTSTGFIILEEYTGENRILIIPGATKVWEPKEFLTVENFGQGPKPDLVLTHLAIPVEVIQQVIATAGEAKIDVLLNAAPAHPITWSSYQYITHLLVNETEAAIMSGRELDEVNQQSWPQIAQEFLKRGTQNVVITLGEKGAYFANEKDRGHAPAYKVEVVDSTGAGDTFNGAYASDYLRQKELGTWDLRTAVEFANKASAFVIGKMGAQEGIPWADDIENFRAELNTKIAGLDPAGDGAEVPQQPALEAKSVEGASVETKNVEGTSVEAQNVQVQ